MFQRFTAEIATIAMTPMSVANASRSNREVVELELSIIQALTFIIETRAPSS
jgi:hypothetical protein